METIRDLAGSMLSSIAAGLKLKASDLDRIRALKTQLEQSKRDNHDRVQEFKEDLRNVEVRLLKLQDEFQRERSAVLQRVVTRELEQACSELELKEGRMDVLFENIKHQATALDKIAELEEALRRGVSDTQADGLSVELEEAFEALQRSDEALQGTANVKYQRADGAKVDVLKHLRRIRGQGPVSI